ncbi:DUF7168 domain-containing protein [Tabrizicola sp.]|uniref:DUF7168 domain-containing protein n=1 Tax=Tabrizicola sp. TaxID=2005166 RepID=UPI002FDC7D70
MDDALRKRIAALHALGTGRGATEAEAEAALAKAADLMRDHGLTAEDIEFEEQQAALKTRGNAPRDQIWGAVGRCTNCATVILNDWSPAIMFLGRAPGPEIATYLVAVLNRAMDREIEAFKATAEYRRRRTVATKRQAVADFTAGLVARLRVRLFDLFHLSMDDHALAKARAVLKQRIPETTAMKTSARSVRFGNAASAGFRAGDRVNLAHGVNGGSGKQRQIGGAM